ncbi:MAG: TFIIB-type zinc ribbon-containing protein [Desulfurococcaceae archaeon]
MKCSACGGSLVWDYEHGEVVCSNCGLVHDKITTLEIMEYKDSTYNNSSETRKPRVDHRYPISRKYKHHIKLYRKCLRIVKGKPWLEVDYDKLLENGKFIHTVKSRASMKALKNIEENGYWDIVREGLEYIVSINPAFLARSERSKYALAYIVAVRIKTGKYPCKDDIVNVFNISDTSYRRLCSIAEKLLSNTCILKC